jgi:predicted nucleic acid-binding protein
MRYVLDISAALCWVLPRAASPQAVRLRDECNRGVHELLAPSLFAAEGASALTKAERQKLIPVGRARLLLADILTTPIRMHSYEPLLREQWRFPLGLDADFTIAFTLPSPSGKSAVL